MHHALSVLLCLGLNKENYHSCFSIGWPLLYFCSIITTGNMELYPYYAKPLNHTGADL